LVQLAELYRELDDGDRDKLAVAADSDAGLTAMLDFIAKRRLWWDIN
jgi:hypothetical protein